MKNYITYIIIFISGISLAQIQQGETTVNREEDFEQESVTVERDYEPKVEAAEKIKQTPDIESPDSDKLSVDYGLKDVEAESDFETTTIGAEELPVDDQNPYSNYIRAGYGNRATLLIDGFGEYALDDDKSVGASVDYYATDGKIPDAVTSTNSAKLDAEGFFKMNFENAQADVRLGGGMHKLNYYGIPKEVAEDANTDDVTQRYSNIYVSGKYKAFQHLFLDEVTLKAGFFGDTFDATESSFDANARFAHDEIITFDIFNGLNLGASADVNLNAANTKFEQVFESKYSYLTMGMAPQVHFQNDILKASVGLNLQYNNESESSTGKTYLFPKAEVFVTAVPEFGFYGGITGDVQQNRYQTLYNENPYLIPNQVLAPTINKMEIYAGIRGDIGTNFKYDASAKYQNMENIPFFSRYYHFGEPYMQANSFSAVYDDGKRTAIEGTINYLGVSNLNLGASILAQTYALDNFEEAWNKPTLSGNISADYKFMDDRLILGSELFFVGARKATQYGVNPTIPMSTPIFDLDAYVDLNLNATYLILDRWAAFLEINNVLNNNYDRFLDYPVQGITAVGGVMFKF